jgi:hypothetical protein
MNELALSAESRIRELRARRESLSASLDAVQRELVDIETSLRASAFSAARARRPRHLEIGETRGAMRQLADGLGP